ncbi:MAG: isochorismate pyruvate lyase [Rhodospirillaceae bacterium]|nr:MAG: isochorismate pyruvate lyase [Rhodospirillaceae bacterium]
MTLCSSLDDVRQQIDRLDNDMVALIVERSHYVREAARFKKTRAEVVVPERIEEIISRVRHHAHVLGGDPELVEKIYRSMIDVYIWHEAKAWLALHGADTA